EAVAHEIEAADAETSATNNEIGGIDRDLAAARADLHETRAVLDEPGYVPAHELFDAVGQLVSDVALATPADCDRCQSSTADALTAQVEAKAAKQNTVGNRVVVKMGELRARYPVETTEFDNSVLSAPGYRDLHRRLVEDDLPRFQAQFKTYLNTNTIRDIAGFHS